MREIRQQVNGTPLSWLFSGNARNADVFADELCKYIVNDSKYKSTIRKAIKQSKEQVEIEKEAKKLEKTIVCRNLPQSIEDASEIHMQCNYQMRYPPMEYGFIKPRK